MELHKALLSHLRHIVYSVIGIVTSDQRIRQSGSCEEDEKDIYLFRVALSDALNTAINWRPDEN